MKFSAIFTGGPYAPTDYSKEVIIIGFVRNENTDSTEAVYLLNGRLGSHDLIYFERVEEIEEKAKEIVGKVGMQK